MNDQIDIQLLGIGAAKIQLGDTLVYVDAFNDYNDKPLTSRNDLILFTHTDGDHFSAAKLAEAIKQENLVLGPPSMSCACIKAGIGVDQIKEFYPTKYAEPMLFEKDDIRIFIYNTDHFVNWHNIHVSYLIEYKSRKIYFTGDSWIRPENENDLKGVDCIIYSLLNENVVKGFIDRKYGKYFCLCEILELKKRLEPKLIVGNHLLDCDWAADPKEVSALVCMENVPEVVIPVSAQEVVTLE